jgi:hypothetical protein
MDDRPGSFLGCAQVRTKVHRKKLGCSVGQVHDPRGLPRVTTARPGVAGVLQLPMELRSLFTAMLPRVFELVFCKTLFDNKYIIL